jgi:hypothetical protein
VNRDSKTAQVIRGGTCGVGYFLPANHHVADIDQTAVGRPEMLVNRYDHLLWQRSQFYRFTFRGVLARWKAYALFKSAYLHRLGRVDQKNEQLALRQLAKEE